jgi:hypothetical protein
MPIIFTLVDSFLKNGLEIFIHRLYLSIYLEIVRGRMVVLKLDLDYFWNEMKAEILQ